MGKYFTIFALLAILGMTGCEYRSVKTHDTAGQGGGRIEIVETLNTGLEVFRLVRVDSTEYLFLRDGGAVVIGKIK